MKPIPTRNREHEAWQILHGKLCSWCDALQEDALRMQQEENMPAAWAAIVDDAAGHLANAAHLAGQRDIPAALQHLGAAIESIGGSEVRHYHAGTLDALRNLHHNATYDWIAHRPAAPRTAQRGGHATMPRA